MEWPVRAVWQNLFLALAIAWSVASSAAQVTWAIYSGSFDPAHEAHLSLVRRALIEDNVGRLYILVNVTGGKDFKASFRERAQFLRQYLGELSERVEILPVRQEEKNSVVIPALKRRHPNERYNVYIGQDSYDVLPEDTQPDPLRSFKVVAREEGSPSSTDIRKAVLEGKPIPHLSAEMAEYLIETGLYQAPPKVFWPLFENLFHHTQKNLVDQLAAEFPGLDLSGERLSFEPQQSRLGWADKLIRWLESKSVTPEVVERAKTILVDDEGRPRFPFPGAPGVKFMGCDVEFNALKAKRSAVRR
jgi:nicotinamide mononucleotide adenylyltransferase